MKVVTWCTRSTQPSTHVCRVKGHLPSRKCKGYIRFNYDVLVRTKRTKIVVSGHVSRAQNIDKCVCGRTQTLFEQHTVLVQVS